MRRNPSASLVNGMLAGAAVMYFFDPDLGPRRRAAVADAGRRAWTHAGDIVDRTANSVREVWCWARRFVGRADTSDQALAVRVRSRLEQCVANPGAIEATVHEGRVSLVGPIFEWEMSRALREVERIRGVEEVMNYLTAHREPAPSSGLKRAAMPSAPVEIPQERWSPSLRASAAVLGSAALVLGKSRRGPSGLLWRTVGAAALTRSLTNVPFSELIGLGGGRPRPEPRRRVPLTAEAVESAPQEL